MALITRFTRLFQADIHAVLDRIEEPDVLLGQAIREMEEDIARDEQRMRVLRHDLRQVSGQQDDMEKTENELHGELDVCFNSGNEDLARVVIRRKLQATQLNRTVNRRHKSITDSLSDVDNRLTENRERLSVMHQKSELLSDNEIPAHRGPSWVPGPAVVSDEDVEVALLREKQRRGVQ